MSHLIMQYILQFCIIYKFLWTFVLVVVAPAAKLLATVASVLA